MDKDSHRQQARDPGTGPQGTRVFRREDLQRHAPGGEERSGAGQRHASGAVLVGVSGAFRGQRIDVPSGRSTLGRDVANTIIVDDDSVSLVHARLVEKNGEWRVLNLLSTNGTWVNNRKVSDGILRNGDKVCFGQAEFVFHNTGAARSGGFWNRLRRWLGGHR
ncbi:MAG TPA: FHA domain-containing protein [Arenicellales bacterium]|nr:FHA domain-containing protein [Arenicellales bacterium]